MVRQKLRDYVVVAPSQSLVEALSPYVVEHNAIIAGGVFKDIGLGKGKGNVIMSRAKDIDLYFRSEEDHRRAVQKCLEDYNDPVYESENSIGFYNHHGFFMDLVKTPYPDAKAVLDTFDFTVVKAAFYKDDQGELAFMKHKQFDNHLKSRVLSYGNDYNPEKHQFMLERLWRYAIMYSFNLTEDTLYHALCHKTANSRTLSGYDPEKIMETARKLAHSKETYTGLTLWDPKKRKPIITANTMLDCLLSHAELTKGVEIHGSRDGANKHFERDFERSIVHAVKYGRDKDQLVNDMRYAAQVLDVDLENSADFAVHPTVTQVGFVDYLTGLNMSTEQYEVLLRAVFGNNGFISKEKDGSIRCKYYREAVDLTHVCDHSVRRRGQQYRVVSDARRDEEAEIMRRVLEMNSDDPEWIDGVVGYFEGMLSNATRTRFLNFFEWEDAIEDEVFSPELPFNLLYEMVRHHESKMVKSGKLVS